LPGQDKPQRIPWSGAIPKRKLKHSINVIADELERIASTAAQPDTLEGFQARIDLLTFSRALVARMNQLVKDNPEQWRELADTEIFWPCLVSLHPHCIKGMASGAGIRDFLEKTLRLGRHHAVMFQPDAKSKLTSPITRTAIELIQHVHRLRGFTYPLTDNPDLLKRAAESRARLTGWRRKADALPPPVKSNSPQWADVCIEAFLESYPNPEQIQELADEIGKRPRDKDAVATHRENPQRIGKRILARLRKAVRDNLVDLKI
jgi:hypothetical protein